MGRYEPIGSGRVVNRAMLILVVAVAAGCLWLLATRGAVPPFGGSGPGAASELTIIDG